MARRRTPHAARVALSVIAWFNAVTAIGGGIALAAGLMGAPEEWLEGTPFSSYLVPGILLAVVVGGIQAAAIVAERRRLAVGPGVHAAAGLTMMTWIFGELAVLMVWAPLQGIYFALGLAQTALAVVALGAWPAPFLARDLADTREAASPRP
jgi:hypothetical protein